MSKPTERDIARIRARQAREDFNIFSRLPAVYAASRSQGQKFLQKGGGLSIVEWRTLWDLHEVGPMTIRDLATIQRADHSLLSRALPEMRRKGFVTMRRDVQDGRQTIVEIADGGRAAYVRAAPVMARRRAALRGYARSGPEPSTATVRRGAISSIVVSIRPRVLAMCCAQARASERSRSASCWSRSGWRRWGWRKNPAR